MNKIIKRTSSWALVVDPKMAAEMFRTSVAGAMMEFTEKCLLPNLARGYSYDYRLSPRVTQADVDDGVCLKHKEVTTIIEVSETVPQTVKVSPPTTDYWTPLFNTVVPKPNIPREKLNQIADVMKDFDKLRQKWITDPPEKWDLLEFNTLLVSLQKALAEIY